MRYRSVLLTLAVCAWAVGPMVAPVAADEPGWVRHTILSGFSGADGVHLADVNGDDLMDAVSGWEQEGIVTLSINPGPDAAAEAWPSVTLVSKVFGVEDAVIADVDADGRPDVISACECGSVTIHFAPAAADILNPDTWTSVTLAGPTQRWIKVAVAQVNTDDQRLDIIAGGKVSPTTVGWFQAPADPRDGSAWTYETMSDVAWTMSLEPRDVDGDGDVDVVLSDRLPIHAGDGTRRDDLHGSRWLENENTDLGRTWINHPIGLAGKNHMFLHLTDFDRDGHDDVLDGAFSEKYNRSFLRLNAGDWRTWETVDIPQPDAVGNYQDVKADDLDLDGDTDLAFTYSEADGDLSGVVLLAAASDHTWQRVEVSGPPGTKYDNLELLDLDQDGDLDIVTSEQVDQLGLIWYENPTR